MVELLDETGRFPRPELLEAALSRLLAETGPPGAPELEVTVVLVDDDAIRERNRVDRGVDDATDVLSYPTMEPDDHGAPLIPFLGDVFISLDTAERQAPAFGRTFVEEVLVLAAHGSTHLLGLDHPTEDAWTDFETAQRRILALAAEIDPEVRVEARPELGRPDAETESDGETGGGAPST